MKISVVTVCFNSSATIEGAIRSVSSQKDVTFEHIIVDGKSTDGTVELIKKNLHPGIKFISEPDSGLYDAMNKGIGMATGDIIGILNSDDLYSDEYVLRDVSQVFENDSSFYMVYGDLMYVKKHDVTAVVRKWISKPYSTKFFDCGDVPPHPTLFLKKEVYEEAGKFNLLFKFAADYEFMFRIFKKHCYKSFYLPRNMFFMRLGGQTNKSISNIIKGNIEILQSWRINGYSVPIGLVPMRILKRLKQFF